MQCKTLLIGMLDLQVLSLQAYQRIGGCLRLSCQLGEPGEAAALLLT